MFFVPHTGDEIGVLAQLMCKNKDISVRGLSRAVLHLFGQHPGCAGLSLCQPLLVSCGDVSIEFWTSCLDNYENIGFMTLVLISNHRVLLLTVVPCQLRA